MKVMFLSTALALALGSAFADQPEVADIAWTLADLFLVKPALAGRNVRTLIAKPLKESVLEELGFSFSPESGLAAGPAQSL